jgi:uncharacterized protein YqhQ
MSLREANLSLAIAFIMLLLWFTYIYREELDRKIKFVLQYNGVKEYQKLK